MKKEKTNLNYVTSRSLYYEIKIENLDITFSSIFNHILNHNLKNKEYIKKIKKENKNIVFNIDNNINIKNSR